MYIVMYVFAANESVQDGLASHDTPVRVTRLVDVGDGWPLYACAGWLLAAVRVPSLCCQSEDGRDARRRLRRSWLLAFD